MNLSNHLELSELLSRETVYWLYIPINSLSYYIAILGIFFSMTNMLLSAITEKNSEHNMNIMFKKMIDICETNNNTTDFFDMHTLYELKILCDGIGIKNLHRYNWESRKALLEVYHYVDKLEQIKNVLNI